MLPWVKLKTKNPKSGFQWQIGTFKQKKHPDFTQIPWFCHEIHPTCLKQPLEHSPKKKYKKYTRQSPPLGFYMAFRPVLRRCLRSAHREMHWIHRVRWIPGIPLASWRGLRLARASSWNGKQYIHSIYIYLYSYNIARYMSQYVSIRYYKLVKNRNQPKKHEKAIFWLFKSLVSNQQWYNQSFPWPRGIK